MNIRNPREYCENVIWIRDKRQKLVQLKFKPAQIALYEAIKKELQEGRPPRIIVLKGRQQGISTITEALMFQDSATRPMVNTLIVAHRDDSTAALFNMNKLFYDYLPAKLQPMKKASNAKELVFENPTRDPAEKRKRPGLRSRIRCITAGGKGAGRSLTQNNVHLSEFAFWPGNKMETLLGIMQSVPDDINTLVVIESTANGYDEFKDLWDGAEKGENGWVPVFLPWFMEPDYRKPVEPGVVWTEEERKLQEQFNLDEKQLAWRRWCIRTNCGGDVNLFRQEYPCTPDEAFLLSGDAFFDNDVIMARRKAAQRPYLEGIFHYPEPEMEGGAPVDWTFVPRVNGFIRIYEEPKDGHPYVLGGDTAGEGSDNFTAYVIDNSTGKQVAELKHPLSEIFYARQVYCLGRYYNDALIGLEINYSTYPQLKLEEWHYPKFYQRERFDTFTGQMVKAFGWATSSKTRPVALAELHTIMEENPELVVSWHTLGEMLTFVYDKDRKPQASSGQHDDLVMAAAICYSIRGQQRFTVAENGAERKNWTADMWEDYNAADAATREMMIRKWGRPER